MFFMHHQSPVTLVLLVVISCNLSPGARLFYRFDFLVIGAATLALIIETSYESCELNYIVVFYP